MTTTEADRLAQADRDEVKPDLPAATLTSAERLARAVLLFHRGGPWTPQDHATWRALAGSPLATTRTLCDLARRVQGGE